MSVNFGLWYDFRNPAQWRRPFGQMYRDYLDQIVRAEQLGFGSVWLTEHHFCEDGYTPSPLVIAGAIGERTRTMRIGTNLIVIPLHDPVRIAEDAATLSLLTGGRFDLGVGIGYKQPEFEAFGRELKNRPSMIEDACEIIRRGWSGQNVNYTGKRFSLGDLPITPVPEQVPALLIGGMAQPAIDRAARIGDGFLSTGGIGLDLYVEALERQGKDPAKGRIVLGCWALISSDPKAEAQRAGPHALYQANEYIRWGAFGPPGQVPEFPDEATALDQGLYELWDANQAVDRLSALLEKYPQIEDIHFWAQLPGEPGTAGDRRIDYIADKILPQLRGVG
jgi:alkanesulfonate monooxygenase SsuD/methylene tetrahydromethanopterin reductase-like flavin-dependent oxidoreductase (luciferase family)